MYIGSFLRYIIVSLHATYSLNLSSHKFHMITMSRFPPIPQNELSDPQKRAHEGVAQLFSRFPDDLKWKNDEGLIFGPYSPLLYVFSNQ